MLTNATQHYQAPHVGLAEVGGQDVYCRGGWCRLGQGGAGWVETLKNNIYFLQNELFLESSCMVNMAKDWKTSFFISFSI